MLDDVNLSIDYSLYVELCNIAQKEDTSVRKIIADWMWTAVETYNEEHDDT